MIYTVKIQMDFKFKDNLNVEIIKNYIHSFEITFG